MKRKFLAMYKCFDITGTNSIVISFKDKKYKKYIGYVSYRNRLVFHVRHAKIEYSSGENALQIKFGRVFVRKLIATDNRLSDYIKDIKMELPMSYDDMDERHFAYFDDLDSAKLWLEFQEGDPDEQVEKAEWQSPEACGSGM